MYMCVLKGMVDIFYHMMVVEYHDIFTNNYL